jgi:hypothetical protein
VWKIVRAGAGAGIFDKLEPDKNGPAPQHWKTCTVHTSMDLMKNLILWDEMLFHILRFLGDVLSVQHIANEA